MKKQKHRTATEVSQPVFEPSLVVTCPCLVTDKYGVAWWVNPDAKTITRA